MHFALQSHNNARTSVTVTPGVGAHGQNAVCRLGVSEGSRTPSVVWLDKGEAVMLARVLLAYADTAP